MEHFDAELEPPSSFTVIVYDVPPPPPEEIIYVDRPVLYFDDPDFDFEPPPPVAIIFLPPPPPDFIVLPPPRPPEEIFVLPVPVFVPVPVWVNPPRNIVPPRDNIIFNNIHNTTVINTINNTTIRNETANQAGQPNGSAEGGLTAGQKMTGAAVGTGAALAAKVALPPLLKKRAGISGQAQSSGQAQFNQNQGGLPLKPGQGLTQGQQPDATTPLSKNLSARKLGTDHALPGADGKALPLVNGKPVLNGRNPPNDRSRKLLGKQDTLGSDQQATGNAGGAVNGEQDTGQRKGKKFRKLPTVNGLPADSGLSAQEKFRKNNPNALSDQGNGKPKRLMRKDLSAGQSIVEPGDQGSANRNDKGKKFGKLPTVNGEPADNRPSVQKHLRKNNPDVFSDQSQGSVDGSVKNKFRRLPTVNGEPTDNGPSMQKRLRRNNPDVFSGENQGSASGNDGGRKFRRLQSEEGSAGPEVNVQRNFKVNRPNENAQRQFKLQENPNAQERRLPQQPKEQPPQGNKKPVCGNPGEPPCKQ
ncbi:hypothetical protein [Mesorhizobium australafricanum]|uniref:hypothetical protein n=1 Tax=Mesorhizobium australafricanum TaxID=3072311 RepID=UPI003D31E3F3